MRRTVLALVVILLPVCFHPGAPAFRLLAEDKDAAIESPGSPTGVEAFKEAEKRYVEKSKAAGMVEHRGIYVPESWYAEYGKINANTLGAREQQKKKEYLEKKKDHKQEFLKMLRDKYKVTLFSKKFAPHDPEKAIDVMIVGDGFTSNEMKRFTGYAGLLPNRLINSAPYSSFKPFFNFHILSVVSPESGVSTQNKKVKTVFDTCIEPGRGNMLYARDIDAAQRYAQLISPPAELVVVVANTMKRARETGSVGYTPGVITIKLNTSINRTVRHELGHAFGGLGDEYVEFARTEEKPKDEPRYPNVTIVKDRGKCKWNYWTKATRGLVGLYEGADGYPKYYYRPEKQCLMRSGEKFCRVCMETMMMKCLREVDLVRNIEPLGAHVVLGRHEKQVFAFDPQPVEGGGASGVWLVDGKAGARGRKFTLSASKLKPGRHIVTLAFAHSHKDVLRGEEYLERTFFWDLEVLPFPRPVLKIPLHTLNAKVGELLEIPIQSATPPPGEEGEKFELKIKCINHPEGAAIDMERMKFLWRPRTYQRGAHVLHFEVSVGELKTVYLVRVNVSEPGQAAGSRPVIFFIPDKEISEGEELSFKVEVVDLDYDNVAVTVEKPPQGARFDPLKNEFSWVPGFFQASDDEYEVVFRATDGHGTSTSTAVKILVRNSRGGKDAFNTIKELVKKGEKDRMRDVEYGLIGHFPILERNVALAGLRDMALADLRSGTLTVLRDYYGPVVLADCVRLMKSKNAEMSAAAAAVAVDIISDDITGDDEALIRYCLDRIKADHWELHDRCDRLSAVLKAIQGKDELPEPLRRAAETLMKKKFD